MGGNLLKTWNLPEKRIPTSEYNQIKDELLNKFRYDFTCTRPCVGPQTGVAPSIRDKDTHGDLDIIIGRFEDPDIQMIWKGEQDFGKYLEKEFGIAPERLQTDGMGEQQPVASNDKPENKAKNRRVEFIKL